MVFGSWDDVFFFGILMFWEVYKMGVSWGFGRFLIGF